VTPSAFRNVSEAALFRVSADVSCGSGLEGVLQSPERCARRRRKLRSALCSCRSARSLRLPWC
jgi:hypothetical protein